LVFFSQPDLLPVLQKANPGGRGGGGGGGGDYEKSFCKNLEDVWNAVFQVSLEDDNLFVLLAITGVTYKTTLNIPLNLFGFKNS